jgi:hypothetical protein
MRWSSSPPVPRRCASGGASGELIEVELDRRGVDRHVRTDEG